MIKIAVLGTLDSKGHEHAFVAECLRQEGVEPMLIDVGTGGPPQVTPAITRDAIVPELTQPQDRGACVSQMVAQAPAFVAKLVDEKAIHGIISLGGGGGTSIATAAMRALPIGFPKLMVSTLASGHTAHYVGSKDIVMMPSIVDVAGLNRVSKTLFTQAAGAIAGMARAHARQADEASAKPIIAASMFGNTTECVNLAKDELEAAGYEVLVFHATGTGGKTMESLIESGMVAGVLDITTTEWADEYVGGTLTAGPTRLEAAGKAGIPAIVVPGCLDMVNFGERDSVPSTFAYRTFYIHNPQVTLMRTSVDDCAQLGKILAEKVNAYTAPVKVLIPSKAISIISAEGQPFHDPEADAALFEAIRKHLNPAVDLIELDCAINDPTFAHTCAATLLDLMK